MIEDNKKTKILLIEDDVFMIELLTRELAQTGFDVTVTKTGTEGVVRFHETKPDLILLDLLLPDENGFDALRRIRRTPEGSEVKVMILSNLSEAHDMDEAKRLGVKEYLIKANFDTSEIIAHIRAVLKS